MSNRPDKLPPYQGGPKFERWFNNVVATLSESQESEFDKMQEQGSLTPKWEDLTQCQVHRRKRRDKRLYGILVTALNSDKITQTSWETEAGSLFGKVHSNRKQIKSSGLAVLSYIRRLRAGTAKTQTASATQ